MPPNNVTPPRVKTIEVRELRRFSVNTTTVAITRLLVIKRTTKGEERDDTIASIEANLQIALLRHLS